MSEKIDELTIVLESIAAAKAAAIASVNALVAVEVMLRPPPEPEVIIDEHDAHGKKEIIRTMDGVFLLCPCGEQRKVPDILNAQD